MTATPGELHDRGQPREGYAQIPNELCRDGSLSSGARSVAMWLYSQADGYRVSMRAIGQALNMDPGKTVPRAMAQLAERRWVCRDGESYFAHPARRMTEAEVGAGDGEIPAPQSPLGDEEIPSPGDGETPAPVMEKLQHKEDQRENQREDQEEEGLVGNPPSARESAAGYVCTGCCKQFPGEPPNRSRYRREPYCPDCPPF